MIAERLASAALAAAAIAGAAGAMPATPARVPAPAARTFANPLLASGADPWIVREGSTYYYMNTLGNRLAIRKTTDLARLADAPEVTRIHIAEALSYRRKPPVN